ncbi:protein phosphatase CheZ [Tepidicaulis sp.]|uniref:protein phosphatase CheZ n=1 Tax=Tepidicaulis sp. TaxID=1920809 RepID=UPI003B5AC147
MPEPVPVKPADDGETRHRELLDAIGRLEARLSEPGLNAFTQAAPVSSDILDQYKSELKEAAKLKSQVERLQDAVRDTQAEIKAMQYEQPDVQRLSHASDELEEVISHNELAADTILSAAEAIDESATRLADQLKGSDAAAVYDIREQSIAILQACNFHDITSQRITKVLRSIKNLEERLESIHGIWGDGAFDDIAVPVEEKDEYQALLHGPALPTEEHCSQEDIDALFD